MVATPFQDDPWYQWPWMQLWTMKHFLVSLGTREILRPWGSAYYEGWNQIFSLSNGPYMITKCWYAGKYGEYWYGSHLRLTVDGEELLNTEDHGPWGQLGNDNKYSLDQNYIGRDGIFFPYVMAHETIVAEGKYAWLQSTRGSIYFELARYSE